MYSVVSVFVLATIATVVLLSLGMFVGYQFGLNAQIVPIVVAAQDSQPVHPPAQAEICLDTVETLEHRSRTVNDIAQRYRESLPPELMMAIDQLVAVATKLGQQLQRTSKATRVGASTESEPLAKNSPQPKETPAVTVSKQLSGKQIRDLTGLTAADGSVKRRYPYDCQQTVYPIVGTQMDTKLAMVVRCHDISVNGISFFLPDEPDFERLVISLGSETDPVFMEADVVQSKLVYMRNDVQTLVGCRLTGKHHSPITLPENHLELAGAT